MSETLPIDVGGIASRIQEETQRAIQRAVKGVGYFTSPAPAVPGNVSAAAAAAFTGPHIFIGFAVMPVVPPGVNYQCDPAPRPQRPTNRTFRITPQR